MNEAKIKAICIQLCQLFLLDYETRKAIIACYSDVGRLPIFSRPRSLFLKTIKLLTQDHWRSQKF